MAKPVILTGLRSNNDLHLGNYLGALKPVIELQKKYAKTHQINVFVPDLHSFTTPVDHSKLYSQTNNHLRAFAACGLDLDSHTTYLYRQSFIPAHSELTIILNSFAYMGELKRMTQFKEKSSGHENITVGLFDYPILMAADILLYGAKYVPVGDDQTQHLEIARDIALRFNEKFGGRIFDPPAAIAEQVKFMNLNERARIRDLVNPGSKMSKSNQSNKGVIFLSDSPRDAGAKVMSATTDSFNDIQLDFKTRPGISNLLTILAELTNQPLKTVVEKYQGQKEYGPLKTETANTVKEFLTTYQTALSAVSETKLMNKVEHSETAVKLVANKTLLAVQKAVGLRE